MYEITKVQATNFRSFKSLYFEPEINEVTFIFGQNKDDGDSNGSGKSSLIKAIIWCLAGITDDGLSSKGYITTGESESTVTITIDSRAMNSTIELTRSVSLKKPVQLSAVLNGEPQGHLFDTKEVEEWLFNKIGVSKEDICNYYLIDQNNNHSFLSATDAVKKSIISRIAGFDFLDEKIEKLKKIRAVQQKKRDDTNRFIVEAEAFIEAKRSTIDGFEVEATEDKDVDSLKEEVNKLTSQIEKTKSIESPPYPTLEDDKLRKAKQVLSEYEGDVRRLKSDLKYKTETISNLTEELKQSLIECPSCSHEFPLSKERSEASQDRIESLTEEIEAITSKLSIDRSEELREAVDEANQSMKAAFNEYEIKRNEFKSISANIEALNKRKNDLIVEIRLAEKSADDANKMAETIEKFRKDIEQKEIELTTKKNELAKIDTRLSNVNYWIKAMSNGGQFRSFLARKTLRTIERHINDTLEQFQIGIKVMLEGFKEKTDGTFSDKINVSTVSRSGKIKPFAALSGGQKARLNICSVIANMDFFNTAKNAVGLNLLIFDEFMENMDINGIRAAEKMLVNSGKTCLIVSHIVTQPTYAKSITVTLEDGISTLP